jgi:hypothetical protein
VVGLLTQTNSEAGFWSAKKMQRHRFTGAVAKRAKVMCQQQKNRCDRARKPLEDCFILKQSLPTSLLQGRDE